MPQSIRQRIQKSSERGIRRCTKRANQSHALLRFSPARHYINVRTSKPRCHLRFFTAGRRSRSGIIYARAFPPHPGAGGERERKISATSRAAFILTPAPHPRCLLSPRRAASSSPSKTGHPRPHAPHCFFRHPSPSRNSLKSIVAYRTLQIRSSVQ